MVALTWVVDDRAPAPLRAEHGFAFWIETEHGRVLFDTGGSGAVLLHNLAHLGLDPGAVDAVVLSHAHDDHTGGLADLLPRLRPGTPLYAHPTLFRARYSTKTGALHSRGMPLARADLAARLDLRLSAEPQAVLPGVWTTGEITERPEPEGRSPYHRVRREGGEPVPDPYSDDLSLVLEVEGGVFLLCGCCHAGLLNTLRHVARRWPEPLVGVAGGTHLSGASPETLARTVEALRAAEALRCAWPGHCSGEPFIDALDAALPAEVFRRGEAGQRREV